MRESKSIIKVLFDARFEELSYLAEEDKNYITEIEVDIDVDFIFSDLDEEIRERIKELLERVNEKNNNQRENLNKDKIVLIEFFLILLIF